MSEWSAGLHLVFAERDDLYGAGSLALRMEQVDRARPMRHDGDLWYPVVGVEIGYGGAELGRRDVLVRARRLPAAADHRSGHPAAPPEVTPPTVG